MQPNGGHGYYDPNRQGGGSQRGMGYQQGMGGGSGMHPNAMPFQPGMQQMHPGMGMAMPMHPGMGGPNTAPFQPRGGNGMSQQGYGGYQQGYGQPYMQQQMPSQNSPAPPVRLREERAPTTYLSRAGRHAALLSSLYSSYRAHVPLPSSPGVAPSMRAQTDEEQEWLDAQMATMEANSSHKEEPVCPLQPTWPAVRVSNGLARAAAHTHPAIPPFEHPRTLCRRTRLRRASRSLSSLRLPTLRHRLSREIMTTS
jgi:hypothetical protein